MFILDHFIGLPICLPVVVFSSISLSLPFEPLVECELYPPPTPAIETVINEALNMVDQISGSQHSHHFKLERKDSSLLGYYRTCILCLPNHTVLAFNIVTS